MLSDPLLETLAAIAAHVKARGYPPSLRELGPFPGISMRGADERVRRLRVLDLIAGEPGASRTAVPTERGRALLSGILLERRCACGAATFSNRCPMCRERVAC